MTALRRSVTCQRVRTQISLDADGHLSEFERRMLEAHLRRCDDCHAYRGDVLAFTGLLRGAPLERTERAIAVRRPRRRQPTRIGMRVAALALPVLAAVLVGQGALTTLGEPHRLQAPTVYPTESQLAREVDSILEGRPAGEIQGIKGQQQAI